MFVWSISSTVAGTLQKVLATDTTTPTPSGCTKVVFAQNTTCTQIPTMTIENANGEQFVLESRGFGVPPYMYFIPDGEYTVVEMTNMKYCNTAYTTLVVGSKFSGKDLGYMSFNAIEEVEKIYSLERVCASNTSSIQTPKGTCKVIFALGANTSMLIQDSEGKKWRIDGSIHPFYYFIKYGTYKVIETIGFTQCNTAQGTLIDGDTFVIDENGSIGYFS